MFEDQRPTSAARRGFIAGLACLGAAGMGQDAKAQAAQDILARADAARNPSRSFRVTDTLTEYRNGKAQQQVTLRVSSKLDASGQYRNLVVYLAPARDAGKVLLMNGATMWFYDPSASASIRISPQQRLVGGAANADVISVNFGRDYRALTAVDETVQDVTKKARQTWKLDLRPARESAAYGRVDYWIEKGTYYPVKARFFSDSGRLLKVIYYGGYKTVLGRPRATEAVIIDQLDTSRVTKMTFDRFEAAEIPDAWFQRDYLPRVKAQ